MAILSINLILDKNHAHVIQIYNELVVIEQERVLELQYYFNFIQQRTNVSLHHVKSHSFVAGNDRADKLAKFFRNWIIFDQTSSHLLSSKKEG